MWRDVVGFEGVYQVSDQGEVRRIGHSRGAKPGRVLQVASMAGSGRRYVTLYDKSRVEKRLVYRAVLEAFVGPCPDGCEANHIDQDPTNDRLGNLEWLSVAENRAHGKSGVLTEMQVRIVCRLAARRKRGPISRSSWGEMYDSELGALFGVSASAVRKIRSGETHMGLLTEERRR